MWFGTERGSGRNVETSPTRNSKYSGIVESERKRSRATVRCRRTAYAILVRTHFALSIHSLFPLGSAPRPGESLRSDNLFDMREENRTPFASGY